MRARERETICEQYKKAAEIVAATCGLCYICEVYTRLHRSKWNKMEHFQVWNANVQSTVQLEKDRNTDLLNTNAADLLV